MSDIPDLPAKDDFKDRPSRARYDKVWHELDRKWRRREPQAERIMREIVGTLWDAFWDNPYSWCGFYVLSSDGAQLNLGPHRDKPACTPLSLKGVCGTAFTSGKTQIVPDVKALANHIECDPANLSEIAVPVFDKDGKAWAVLDVDSKLPAAFNEMDQRWLERLVKVFQLTHRA
jgi:GAF domain-containing protein